MLAAGLGEPDVLVAPVGQVLVGEVVVVVAGVLAVEYVAHAVDVAARHRHQAPAGARPGYLQPHRVQDGGHYVLQSHGPLRSQPRGKSPAQRRPDDEWHPGRRLVRERLLQALVVAQHLAVVGGHDDQHVVHQVPHELVQPADLVVDEVDHAVVGRPGRPQVVLRQAYLPVAGVYAPPRRVVHRSPVADEGLRQLSGHVAVVVELRRRERRVRVDEGEGEEERRRRVAAREKVHGAVDDPERVHLLLGQDAGAAAPAPGVHALRLACVHLHPAVPRAEPLDVVVVRPCVTVRELDVLEAVPLALRGEVHLADHLGLVAGVRQLPGQRVRRVPLHVLAPHDAVGRGRHPAHDAAARGDAGRRLRVPALKQSAVAGVPVEVLGLQRVGRQGVEPYRVVAVLVGDDEQDVGPLHGTGLDVGLRQRRCGLAGHVFRSSCSGRRSRRGNADGRTPRAGT